MTDEIKRWDVGKLDDLEEFMSDRDAVRVELENFGLPKAGKHTKPVIRGHLRIAVSRTVRKYNGREYVYAASLALNEIKISTNSTPIEFPELWCLAAILGKNRGRYSNETYLKREACALRNARLQGISEGDLLPFLSRDRKKIERPSKRCPKKKRMKGAAG